MGENNSAAVTAHFRRVSARWKQSPVPPNREPQTNNYSATADYLLVKHVALLLIWRHMVIA